SELVGPGPVGVEGQWIGRDRAAGVTPVDERVPGPNDACHMVLSFRFLGWWRSRSSRGSPSRACKPVIGSFDRTAPVRPDPRATRVPHANARRTPVPMLEHPVA